MSDLVHLHVHTVYSFLDGLVRPKELAARCRELKMGACAVTDHGHMGGSLRAYKELKKAGVKPIMGMEAHVGSGHLVLLVRNREGYDNLRALATLHAHGPLKMEDVARRASGLYALTACVRGHVPTAVYKRDYDRARAILRSLKKIFGRDNVGVELQFNAGPMPSLAPRLADLAEDVGLDIVATNDVHYLRREEAEAQNTLMAIRQLGKKNVFRHPAPEYWLKSELGTQGQCFKKALDNTHKVAERCNLELKLDVPDLPSFSDDEDGELSRLAREGFKRRGMGNGEPARRLVSELAVIQKMGFSGYFLIVQDFVNWARDNGVYTGPGRGSGAGSLVAYCLGITDLDPLEHGLFFERFLNPERVSMPDFDIDFSQAGRDRVIDYVRDKYGHEHVGQIATYYTLSPKSAIKDVARVRGLSFEEVNKLTRGIPSDIRPRTTEEEEMDAFDLTLTYAPALKALAKKDEDYKWVLKIARELQGACRQTGKHAGGVVIGRLPLENYTPLTAEGATAYDMKDVEAAGLVKFDFLGLKTLDVIENASRHARVDVSRIPLDDKRVYRQMSTGNTWGMFQIESPGMTDMITRLEPSNFGDVVASVALYRPGPKESGMLDSFINRRHGREEVVYPHPSLESVLSDTWGTIVYQEQVMQVAQELAGYSLGAADILRRAMGKKIKSEMDAQALVFARGCRESGIDERLAEEIFHAISKHAAYSFNRSHAAAYAMITYQTAWLKCHHALEFTAALLTTEHGDLEVLARYLRAARKNGIVVQAPNVNISRGEFTVVDGIVNWGLSAVKGLGLEVVEDIVVNRPYSDFFDLVARVPSLNSRAVKRLVASGACDEFGESRSRLLCSIPRALENRRVRKASRGQVELVSLPPDLVDDHRELSREEECADEFEALGAFVTFHPSDWIAVKERRPSTYANGIKVVGTVVDIFVKYKNGRPWAKVTIEDRKSDMIVLVFYRAYEAWGHELVVGKNYRFEGRAGDDGEFVAASAREL